MSKTPRLKMQKTAFSSKISSGLPKDDRRFAADMSYGILASGSCLLTDITDHLHEPAKKVNSVERLSRHLAAGIPKRMLANYLHTVRTMVPFGRTMRSMVCACSMPPFWPLCMGSQTQ